MFSYCRQELDAEGRDVIEIGMDLKKARAIMCAVPVVFVVAGYFFMGIPLIVAALFLAFLIAAFVVIGSMFMGIMAKASEVRVTMDVKAGRILVATASGQSEIRMADVTQAEFGSRISSSTDSDNNTTETTVYRLEFVMKDGKREPATAAYSSVYSSGHRAMMVTAINGALRRRMA